MNYRDFFERLLWAVVSAVGGVVAVALADLDLAWVPIAVAAVNALTQFARAKLSFLPNPGSGLPGLPVQPGEPDEG